MLSRMHTTAWLLVSVLSGGCSSESVSERPQTAPNASTGTSNAATPVAGDFAPVQAYAEGPFGRGEGAAIENLEFIGWRDPSGVDYDVERLEHLRLGDFYDPIGAQTEIIVLNASAVWCPVCRSEMHDMLVNGTYKKFHQRKAEVLGTLFQDNAGDPAKPSDLEIWGSSPDRLIDFPLVLDPALKMGIYFTSDATPLNLIVDARTMKILHVFMGYDASPLTGCWALVDQELADRGL